MSRFSGLETADILSSQGKFKAASEALLEAAKFTDNILKKGSITLSAVGALVAAGEYELAKKELEHVKVLMATCLETGANPNQDDMIRIAIGIKFEEANLISLAGRAKEATEGYAALLEEYETSLKHHNLHDLRDAIVGERAFLLVDLGVIEQTLPTLEKLEPGHSRNAVLLFYLGYCYVMVKEYRKARTKLKDALAVGLPPHLDFRAHCSLDIAYYFEADYANAKIELEIGAKTASERYLKEARIWKWLEGSCTGLGQTIEAERYRKLSRSS
jgi:tetratricopeptide (TPR) repeat protein